MPDPTEAPRRQRLAEINASPGPREALEAEHGKVWDTNELTTEFTVTGFLAPLVVVRRKADGVVGSLEFQNDPRLYFNWKPHKFWPKSLKCGCKKCVFCHRKCLRTIRV